MPRGVNLYDEERLQGRNVANANAVNIVSPGIVEDGLVLHLDAGNFASFPAAGTTWYDLSERRNHGTLTNGPAYSLTGNGSISFDASNDYVEMPSNPIQTNGSFSIELWFRITTLNSVFRALFDCGNLGNGTQGYTLAFNNSNRIFIAVDAGFVDVSTSISANTWTHVVGTAQSATPYVLRVYVNGVNGAVAGSATNNTLTNNATVMRMGRAINQTLYYPGNISNARLYNRALTPTEVEQNFNATRARFGV